MSMNTNNGIEIQTEDSNYTNLSSQSNSVHSNLQNGFIYTGSDFNEFFDFYQFGEALRYYCSHYRMSSKPIKVVDNFWKFYWWLLSEIDFNHFQNIIANDIDLRTLRILKDWIENNQDNTFSKKFLYNPSNTAILEVLPPKSLLPAISTVSSTTSSEFSKIKKMSIDEMIEKNLFRFINKYYLIFLFIDVYIIIIEKRQIFKHKKISMSNN